MTVRLEVVQGDIVALDVDAIVNAANSALCGGGGVDGAIHYSAGPQLLEACRRLGRCDFGDAKITPGFKLKAAYVIHAVGPVWRGGGHGEPRLLASCYRRSLELATEQELKSIAFPSISTGAFRYPIELAAPIAVAAVRDFIRAPASVEDVVFCCFSPKDFSIYRKLLEKAGCS
jgi:O-acetyl-ADP-ribose deacetylase (regulator of RNase III)